MMWMSRRIMQIEDGLDLALGDSPGVLSDIIGYLEYRCPACSILVLWVPEICCR